VIKISWTIRRLPMLNRMKMMKCGQDQEMRRSSGKEASGGCGGGAPPVRTDAESPAGASEEKLAFTGTSSKELILLAISRPQAVTNAEAL